MHQRLLQGSSRKRSMTVAVLSALVRPRHGSGRRRGPASPAVPGTGGRPRGSPPAQAVGLTRTSYGQRDAARGRLGGRVERRPGPRVALGSGQCRVRRGRPQGTRALQFSPRPGVIAVADGDDAAAWLRGIGDALFLEPLEKDEIERARALLDLPPRLAVLGDFSSGKTGLIKRLLAETGSPTPNSLRVHATPATDAIQRHPFGPFTLVDAPGFQSRADGHDTVAFAAAESAALVLVVLHVLQPSHRRPDSPWPAAPRHRSERGKVGPHHLRDRANR